MTWREPRIVHLFRSSDFESAMSTLCVPEHEDPLLDRLTHELCEYLASFSVDPTKRNYYAIVMSILIAQGRLPHALLCTLNYDCLMEEALCICLRTQAARHPFSPDRMRHVFTSDDCKHPLESPTVLKLHGSVNYSPGVTMNNCYPRTITAPMQAINMGDELRAFYASARAEGWCESPLIAHYAPGKPYNLNRRLEDLPSYWQSWVQECEAVFIIGVNTTPDDWHIWRAFSGAWQGHVYYVGVRADGHRLEQLLGDRFHHLADTFEAAAEHEILKVLSH